jgi:hypothetical protein
MALDGLPVWVVRLGWDGYAVAFWEGLSTLYGELNTRGYAIDDVLLYMALEGNEKRQVIYHNTTTLKYNFPALITVSFDKRFAAVEV